jgi:hypothetical protein
VVAGRVDREVAANAATNRHDFLVSLEHALKRHKYSQDVADQQAEQARHDAAGTGLPELRLA